MSNMYGRQVIVALTNKSGGGVVAGDVVIVDTSNDAAFTTSTAGAVTSTIGIAQETIASNATGRVLTAGYAALVNVNASVTRGNFGKTHTVAKQATDAGSSRTTGTFCQFLTAGTTPTAILFGYPDSAAGGSGAPTSAQYIVGASDGTLSAEKVRADLYKNYDPDNYPTSGTTWTDEFDDGSVAGSWSWTGSAPTHNETDFAGFLHVTSVKNVTNKFVRAFTPGANAFTICAKIALAARNQDNASWTFGIALFDSSDTVIWQHYAQTDGATATVTNTRMIGTAGTLVAISAAMSTWLYLAIQRDASTNYVAYYSLDGIIWIRFGGSSVAGTVAKAGFIIPTNDNTGNDREALADFFRVFSSATLTIGA